MAVHFKFRSSVKFDSVDLEDRQSSITVGDLKSRILRLKHLNLCRDSDLLFSDAVTGQEYSNENVQIPRGASVIIKRVPAGSVRVDTLRLNCEDSAIPQNIETIDFDDFGVDVYPVTEAEKEACSPGYGCLEPAVGECLRVETSGASDAKPGSRGGVEHPVPQTQSKAEVQEIFNPEKLIHDPVDAKLDDLPSEMKCSLCKSLFMEAVMIPCCQHSFCAKCIGQVLLEKERCPKCFSTKCRIADLLPNISLRQAIEHLKEAQNLITAPDNGFGQYAPDAESGIQAKDVSYGGSGKGNKRKAPLHKNNRTGGERDDLAAFDDFQAESKPIPEKAEPATKKKGPPWVFTAGGGKGFMDSGKIRKGDRACYMCGSADHLIRECPIATSPHPMLNAGNATFSGAMPGYVPPYWNGVPLPHALPFRSPYGNHGMMAFNNMSIPPTPFSFYPHMHMPSSAIPGFGHCSGYMGRRGVAPFHRIAENCDISSSEFPEGQQKRRKYTKENFKRDQSCDDDDDDEGWGRKQYNGTTRLQEHRYFDNQENSVSYSGDGSAKKFQEQDRYSNEIDDDDNIHLVGDHLKSSHEGKRYNRSENSSSEIDDMPRSSSWHSEEKHNDLHRSSRKKIKTREQCCDKPKYHHKSSRYQKERNERYGNDSSWSHHRNISEADDKRKRQKHHSNSGSGLGHSVCSDKKLHRGSSHDARKSEHNAKSSLDEASHDRWKMVSGSECSDEDHTEEYRYCKQKRVKCC